MRVSEKLDLIDRIGRELQSRYTYTEIDRFLAEFAIEPHASVSSNSKWVYSKAALSGIAIEKVLRIAQELDIGVGGQSPASITPPANWAKVTEFRLFISHVSKDKLKATRLKSCLEIYGISGFVAHEDIHPTLEWQSEIERALNNMDAFIAIHTPGSSNSNWTQQEIGFALGKGVKVISFKMGEDPTGFISRHQALARRDRTAEEVAKEINDLLLGDERTFGKLSTAQGSKQQPVLSDDIPF